MKNKYPLFAFWEIVLVLLGWSFLNFRWLDYVYQFKFSYNLVSLVLSGGTIFWLAKAKNFSPGIFPDRQSVKKLPSFILLAAITLVPTGLLLGFLVFNFNLTKFLAAPVVLVGVYFTIGFVEELVFRQIVLVYLWQKFNFPTALVVSSLLFGFSHIVRGGFPNWPYVLLASLAGVIYAWSFVRLNLGSAALLHSLVDTIKYLF